MDGIQTIIAVVQTITFLAIMWYSFETYKIRKAEVIIAKTHSEALHRMQRPIIGYTIYNNKKRPIDTFFKITNHSNYPVSVLVKCNFKLNDNIIENIWPAYDGKEYWNLQYSQSITGKFCWFDLYSRILSYDNYKLKELKQYSFDQLQKEIYNILVFKYNIIDEPNNEPKLTMDIEIYCINDMGKNTYYPPQHYEFDPWKLSWIFKPTSKKPYWEYGAKPEWVEDI